MRDRLLTRDRLLGWGLQVPPECLLCNGGAPKTRTRLFFTCPFSLTVYRVLFSHPRFTPPTNLMDSIIWIKRSSSLRKLRTICSLVLQATVYELWKERNIRLHSNTNRPSNIIFKEIERIREGIRVQAPNSEETYLSLWFGYFQFATEGPGITL